MAGVRAVADRCPRRSPGCQPNPPDVLTLKEPHPWPSVAACPADGAAVVTVPQNPQRNPGSRYLVTCRKIFTSQTCAPTPRARAAAQAGPALAALRRRVRRLALIRVRGQSLARMP